MLLVHVVMLSATERLRKSNRWTPITAAQPITNPIPLAARDSAFRG